MITLAKVVSTDSKYAIVEAARKSACEGCHKNADGKSCSVCSLLGGERLIRAKAKNTVNANVGDTVEISSSSGKMLIYAFLVFILPLITAIVAYFIASETSFTEGIRLLFAAAGFLAVLFADMIISKVIDKKCCDIEIVKIINKNI